MDAVEFAPQVGPAPAGACFGDTDQQQPQPAEQDVGADAVLAAVVDQPEVEHGLHLAPAALDLQKLLVPQGDTLGRQCRVAGAW
ncbi:hypothetical protein LUX31_04480 [Streptomyces sp. GQFP]|nr:hypothetical protein [Streptomyces sp. GQFP]UIX29346.1 hypothetical protein LUX31_04480 [Streptomyces sp. GQFP]